MPESYVASLGRISGKLLAGNLLRNGSDLTFRNAPTDDDLLYLDVNNMRLGINNDAPLYDLHIDTDVRTTVLNVTDNARIDNITIDAAGSFGSYTGPINIVTSDVFAILNFNTLKSDYIEITNNRINSLDNRNIQLDPNGTGYVIFEANTETLGDVDVVGNITMGGNLRADGTITVGDNILDTVTINTDFTQSIIPGTDLTYDLGTPSKRWAELHSPVWQQVIDWQPNAFIVSEQTWIDGVANKISAIQSNEDLTLAPDTGVVYIERTKWQDDDITNLDNTALTFASTGIGYTRFMGTNAMLIPAGSDLERPGSPELGDTRWNTDLDYLECFAGLIESVSATGSVVGLINQTKTSISGTTNGLGTGATFTLSIFSDILSITITAVGQGYLAGDTITIIGTVFTGGTTPANDIELTIGSQTNGGYVIATGGGETVTTEIMEDLGNVYSLILG